jgi:hypothetical protein
MLKAMAAGCLVIGSDTASVGEEGIQQHPAAPAEKDNETYYQNNVSITYLKSGFYGWHNRLGSFYLDRCAITRKLAKRGHILTIK